MCKSALDKPHSAQFTFTDAGIDSTIASPKSLYAKFAHQRTVCADEQIVHNKNACNKNVAFNKFEVQ
jgi:hypothetical protein